MENQKTDDQIWDELLNSEDGKKALDHLLLGADLDIATDKVMPLFDESSEPSKSSKTKLSGKK